MKTNRLTTTVASALALALLSALPALAQATQPQAERVQADERANPTLMAAGTRLHNQRLMEDALREFGFDRDRLRRDQLADLDDAQARLLPEESPRRYRLNVSQARAIVYLALVYPRGTRGGGWGGGDDRDDDDDGGYGRPGRNRCAAVDQGVYQLINLTSGQGEWGILNEEEKIQVRRTAEEVQRAAIDRGFRAVADRAADVIGATQDWAPNRSYVAQRVAALKAAADEACGDRGSSRW